MENLVYASGPVPTVEPLTQLTSTTYVPEDRLEHFKKEMAMLEVISARKEAEYMSRLQAQATNPFLRGKRLRELQLISQRRLEAKAKRGEANVGKSRPSLSNVAVARLKVMRGDLGATTSNALGLSHDLETLNVDLHLRGIHRPCVSRQGGACTEQTPAVPCTENPPSGSAGTTGQGQNKVDLNSFANDMNLPQEVVAEIFEKWPHGFDDSVCSQFFQDFERGGHLSQDVFGSTYPSSPAVHTGDRYDPLTAAVQFFPETIPGERVPECGFENNDAYSASSFDPPNVPPALPGRCNAVTMPRTSGSALDSSWLDAAPPSVHMPASNGHSCRPLAYAQQPGAVDRRSVLPLPDYPVASICNEQRQVVNCSAFMQNLQPATSMLDGGLSIRAPQRPIDCRLGTGNNAHPVPFTASNVCNPSQQVYNFLPYNQNSAQYYHSRNFT